MTVRKQCDNGFVCSDEFTENYDSNLQPLGFIVSFSSLFNCRVCSFYFLSSLSHSQSVNFKQLLSVKSSKNIVNATSSAKNTSHRERKWMFVTFIHRVDTRIRHINDNLLVLKGDHMSMLCFFVHLYL